MKTRLIVLAVAMLTIFGCVAKNSVSDTDIGLRHTDLLSEGNVKLRGVVYDATPAGESKMIDRAFENAPPLISHDVDGMMEISKDLNMCTACHLPDMAEAAKATPMPPTHFIAIKVESNTRAKTRKLSGMNEERYNCTACHVPQAVGVDPLVENTFDPVLRTEKAKTSSNLIDQLNEGIR